MKRVTKHKQEKQIVYTNKKLATKKPGVSKTDIVIQEVKKVAKKRKTKSKKVLSRTEQIARENNVIMKVLEENGLGKLASGFRHIQPYNEIINLIAEELTVFGGNIEGFGEKLKAILKKYI